ncbi:MAG: 2-oxo acid dehydrogenase subunit E2 [Proteobacteria bacterium]|nr:2-oxo acid dehydrogenase subunit E2 [Pseudomonadota bacterium]
MITDVVMPRLGMTMEKGKIISWNAKEGDTIEKENLLLTVETEKVTYEIVSPQTGILHIVVAAEEEAPVGGLIGFLASTREEYKQVKTRGPQPAAMEVREAPVAAAAPPPEPERGGHVKVSGIARKMAMEHGLDLTLIKGTGLEGRITKEDVLQALEVKEKKKEPAPPLEKREEPARPLIAGKRVKEIIPLTGMIKAMAEHMLRSRQSTAQVTNWEDVDMTELIKLREELLKMEPALGVRVSYTDIFAKIVGVVLKEFPLMNSSLEGEEIRIWEDINLGIAVNLEKGLIVPVVHQTHKKSLVEVSREISALIERARQETLTADDVTGGTYTISNLGSVGGIPGTPVLVAGQMGIIAFGGVFKRPWVVDDQIVIKPLMRIASTVDHRIISGVVHHSFRMLWLRYLQQPSMLILGL